MDSNEKIVIRFMYIRKKATHFGVMTSDSLSQAKKKKKKRNEMKSIIHQLSSDDLAVPS